MKITLIKTNKKNMQHLKLHTPESFQQLLHDDYYQKEVGKLREFCRYAHKYSEYEFMYRLPVVSSSTEMKADKEGNLLMKRFNGLLTLTVGVMRDEDEVEAVKQRCMMLPMTMMALTGSSRRTVKLVVAVCRADGLLPQQETEAEKLCQQAYPIVCQLYETIARTVHTTSNLTVTPALRKGDNSMLHAGFRMTFDEHPIINDNAVAMTIPDTLDQQPIADIVQRTDTTDNSTGQLMRQLIDFMEQTYDFRMNTIMGYVEYCPKDKPFYGWQPVDERAQNTIAMKAQAEGLNVWDKDIVRYLKSNMVRDYSPVTEFLLEVRGKWDGTDHIGALAATVPNDNPYWPQWFKTWFLGMVAQWIGRNTLYGNAIAPLLISKQGYNKSTFCKSLLPPQLQWGYNDNLVLSEKKSVLQAMSQFLLINLDEFNQIPPKVQEGFLKNLIQLASVKVKRPYAKHVEDFPRMASFIATANVSDILTDPSGNRRFIGIELTGPIDVRRRIKYTQLYAQAMALLEQDEPHWLDPKQTQLVMQSNQQFQLRSPEELYFSECFALTDNEEKGQWMTSTVIFDHIRKAAGAALKGGNIQRFGRVLSNIEGLKSRRTNRGTEYLVKPLR